MPVHPTYRGTLGVASAGASRTTDPVLYSGTGAASGGTLPTGQVLSSSQAALRLRRDPATPSQALEVTIDGGSSWYPVEMGQPFSRVGLTWQAGARGKPGVNGDIQNTAESVRMIADPNFEVSGTNATSGSTAFSAEGGITLTTAGADGDEVILVPHQDASQSAWGQYTWGTDKELIWEAVIETDSNITNAIIWAGLKLTSTEVTATDDDQIFFRYEDDVNDGEWQAVSSIAGTDDAHDTGVVVAVSTVYRLKITVDSSRVARFYINDTLVETSAALTDATDLVPFIGVAADGAAAAKAITVYGQSISRVAG